MKHRHSCDSLDIRALRHLLCALLCDCEDHTPQARVTLAIPGGFSVTFIISEGSTMTAASIPDDKVGNVTVSYVDAKGNAAQVDGNPVFESGDQSVFTVEVDPADPFKAKLVPAGLGTAQLKVTADADMGGGVEEIVTLADITIIAGKAVAGNVTVEVADA